MRRRHLKAYWKRLGELQQQEQPRDTLLQKLGAAQDEPVASLRVWSRLR